MYELSSGASIGTKDRCMSKQGGEMGLNIAGQLMLGR